MSATIWCMTPLSKEQDDDVDHSLEWDDVAKQLGSRKPGDFFDSSEFPVISAWSRF